MGKSWSGARTMTGKQTDAPSFTELLCELGRWTVNDLCHGSLIRWCEELQKIRTESNEDVSWSSLVRDGLLEAVIVNLSSEA